MRCWRRFSTKAVAIPRFFGEKAVTAKDYDEIAFQLASEGCNIESIKMIGIKSLRGPSNHQLERFIRECAADSFNVAFTKHALTRMKQRKITALMALEALRLGCMTRQPEPDMKHPGLKCRMERLVSGVLVGVEVYVEHPAPDLTVVTVINLGE